MGWGGVVVVCLIIVSTPVPDFVKVKARFVQFGLANRLAMSRTRLVKARARSLTIIKWVIRTFTFRYFLT